jgi:hypothetical protein
MIEYTLRNPMNIILEGYQPTSSGNVDPKNPPKSGSALVPRWVEPAASKLRPRKPTQRPANR